jgi:cytochrome P450
MSDTLQDSSAVAEEQIGKLIFDPVARADPYPIYATLRAMAPLHQSSFGPWFVGTYEECAALLRDPRLVRRHGDAWEQRAMMQNSLGRDWFDAQGRWMLWLDPPDHTRLRGLVSKAFTPRYIARLKERVVQIVDDLLDDLRGAGEFDLIAQLAFPVPITIICDMLGVPKEDRDSFRGWTVEVAGTLEPLPPPDVQDAADEATRRFIAYFRELIAARRNDDADDLLCRLIHAEEDGERLTEDEIIAQATLLLGAGFETTTNLIGNGSLALLRHPDQWEKLVSGPERARGAVEELLRYDSPVQMATPRVTNTSIEVMGREIPETSTVLCVVGSANRDPSRYVNADGLDIERQNVEPLSFGGGPHFCLGASLARMEGAIVFEALATKLPHLELVEENPTWRRSLNIRGLGSLTVRA